jgi:hypothetical protein
LLRDERAPGYAAAFNALMPLLALLSVRSRTAARDCARSSSTVASYPGYDFPTSAPEWIPMRPCAFLAIVLFAASLSPATAAQASSQAPLPAPTLAATSGCQAQWLPTFGQSPGTAGPVLSLCEYDDGSGPALFVGGRFQRAGGVASNYVAKWDGSTWSRPGVGLDPLDPTNPGYVYALCVYDDGNGPALYVAGRFESAGGVALHGIGRWDGSSWTALGSGTLGEIHALEVFDDGSGPALYAGGWFTSVGGVPVSGIAKWDGNSWSALGSGLSAGANPGFAFSLAVFDDGTGAALYAGGGFTGAGGQPASGIARWDGSVWSALGGGVGGATPYVQALSVYDDGSGRALFAGGAFSTAGGASANRLAKWNGSAWSALGGGTNGEVHALTVFDNGSGIALYAGGDFTTAGGSSAPRVARWNGASWSAEGNLYGGAVEALAVFDDGGGRALFAGGLFASLGATGLRLPYVAKRSGSAWTALGSGISGSVGALATFDDGSGPALHAAGYFDQAGGVLVHSIARWDGSHWSALGSGLLGSAGYSAQVAALAVYDDGSGPALYAGGLITNAGGVTANGIAKWNGTSWSALGNGVNGSVASLAVFDDGSGPCLYVGGNFVSAGQLSVMYLARWNGAGWAPVGNGIAGEVDALLVWDDGTGPALYAGGRFWGPIGGPATHYIAKWNGTSWTGLGGGLTGTSAPTVRALAAYDDGSGSALYVGGEFTSAGTTWARNVAKWNGAHWSALGAGLEYAPGSGGVHALAPFDDGSGTALFASGVFTVSGGLRLHGIAHWQGGQWSAVGSGLDGWGQTLRVFDDGSGRALYAGGNFPSCPDSLDSSLAKWGQPPGCAQTGVVVCEPGAGGVSACPCANPASGLGRGCDNSSATGGAVLAASGTASLANDTLVFTTSGETPSALSLVLQGDALNASGAVFGQGVRCVSGALKRLYVKTASGGSITAPGAGDPSVHARSAALGDTITQGSQRYYGVYYRDPVVLGGCPATSTFNITQQLDVLWLP